MQALGELACGIAHDLNSIIGAVYGNLDLAEQQVGTGHPAGECLLEIRRVGERAALLVRRMMAWGNHREENLRPVSLEPVVREAVGLLRAAIPVCSDPVPQEPELARGAPRGLGERVLLVDDEYAIRRSAKVLLERHGYAVVAAESARMALEIFGAGEAFDVVVTDLTMPGGSGLEVIRGVGRLQPGTPVILVSGFADEYPPETWRKLEVKGFVAKPFSAAELLRALRMAIDRQEVSLK